MKRTSIPLGPCPESVLALDVSSKATGWAIVRRDLSLGLFGLIKPKASLSAVERIDEMVYQLCWTPGGIFPRLVVMEWTSGKVARRLDARRVSGLAILGHAQGSVRQSLLGAGCTIHLIPENEWTGSVPKARRALRIAQLYPDYSAWSSRDGDHDTADAIGLGVFFMQRAKLGEMVAQAGAKS